MQIHKINSTSFTQNKQQQPKVWEPRIYYIDGTTVTLSAEEERLYRTSLKNGWKTLGKWMLGSVGIASGIACCIRPISSAVVPSAIVGGIIGLCGSLAELLITGKTRYSNLPYDKLVLENGLARHNLATMNMNNNHN